MNNFLRKSVSVIVSGCVLAGMLSGCGNTDNGKTVIEVMQYKREAIDTFDDIVAEFEAQNPDIDVVITSPNDATVMIKTRLIKNNAPDIIGIGGDRAFADFVYGGVIEDISDFEGLSDVKPEYLQMTKDLELIPTEGIYAVPFAANANGVLYNKDMFAEHGWEIPKTWDEFISLLEQIKSEGVNPLYFTLKEAWTDLAAWNSIDASINGPELFQQANEGETTFSEAYSLTADKYQQLLQYGQDDPFAYGYNDGCIAFGSGESAMFLQGSWAIPQILSSNPDMNIGCFPMPATNSEEDNVLTSGIDLLFSVMKGTEHREECLRFIDFIIQYNSVKKYTEEQQAVSCIKGDFEYADSLKDLEPYFEAGKIQDFPDHHYPAEMPGGDMIQGFLLNGDKEAFLNNFDTEWIKTNRDIINKLKKLEEQS